MSDIEEGLRSAMHAALDTEQASPDELIRLVVRRHRMRTTRLAGVAVLAALAIAVSATIGLHSAISTSRRPPSSKVTPKANLPTRLSGLPMPAGMNFEFLESTSYGAAWYSTATRRTEPVAGLPASLSGYQFERVWGGWVARAETYNSPCKITKCAGPPATFYFIADGSTTATRIGKAYAQDGINPASRAGAVWLTTYPRSSTQLITGASSSQLVNTVGQPLGPRYRMPVNYLMGRGVGNYLLLVLNTDQTQFELWDPATGRVLGHFDNVVAQGSGQIAWTNGCGHCQLEITNASTGKTLSTSIPGGQPANLSVAFSDDGRLLAVQAPGQQVAIINTVTGSMTRLPGTALSVTAFEYFDWQNEGHRLIILAGSHYEPGPDQIAYWQSGDARLYVVTIRNAREIPEVESGSF
jgi:hypothetical protein